MQNSSSRDKISKVIYLLLIYLIFRSNFLAFRLDIEGKIVDHSFIPFSPSTPKMSVAIKNSLMKFGMIPLAT